MSLTQKDERMMIEARCFFFQRSTFSLSSSILCHHPHERYEETCNKTRQTLIFFVLRSFQKSLPENYVSNAVIHTSDVSWRFLVLLAFLSQSAYNVFLLEDRNSTNVLLLLPLIIHRTAVVLVAVKHSAKFHKSISSKSSKLYVLVE